MKIFKFTQQKKYFLFTLLICVMSHNSLMASSAVLKEAISRLEAALGQGAGQDAPDPEDRAALLAALKVLQAAAAAPGAAAEAEAAAAAAPGAAAPGAAAGAVAPGAAAAAVAPGAVAPGAAGGAAAVAPGAVAPGAAGGAAAVAGVAPGAAGGAAAVAGVAPGAAGGAAAVAPGAAGGAAAERAAAAKRTAEAIAIANAMNAAIRKPVAAHVSGGGASYSSPNGSYNVDEFKFKGLSGIAYRIAQLLNIGGLKKDLRMYAKYFEDTNVENGHSAAMLRRIILKNETLGNPFRKLFDHQSAVELGEGLIAKRQKVINAGNLALSVILGPLTTWVGQNKINELNAQIKELKKQSSPESLGGHSVSRSTSSRSLSLVHQPSIVRGLRGSQ